MIVVNKIVDRAKCERGSKIKRLRKIFPKRTRNGLGS